MNVQIILDPPPGGVFTNLDVVSGKIVLRLSAPSKVSAVTVKLEGEANSVLQFDDMSVLRSNYAAIY
jgi:hypothetical protein